MGIATVGGFKSDSDDTPFGDSEDVFVVEGEFVGRIFSLAGGFPATEVFLF